MSRSTFQRLAMAVLLTLVLAPWGHAAEIRRESARPHTRTSATIFECASRLFTTLVSRLWTKEGCGMDPNGYCTTTTSVPAPTKVGCGIDPDGHCTTTSAPAPTPVTDAGCGIDPHGCPGR